MNFQGHVRGGIVTATATTMVAASLNLFLDTTISSFMLGLVFGTTLFFSLFPDLDISSIPQRWFFRTIFVVLLILNYFRYYDEALLLALLSMTPLLDHHRGWTHNLYSVVLFPFLIASVYEYLLKKHEFFVLASLKEIPLHLWNHAWLVVACLVGWYTHLFLDFWHARRLKKNRA